MTNADNIQTAPLRKLPALYVLDSIVKNVGTPYTVYLGRGLYTTFMEAYTQVDGVTRRSMEGMLKTWKEPVPGSMDPRPVFPPETVRPLENALLKAKTAVLQSQRQVQPQEAFRYTSTPPQQNGQFAPPYAQYQQPQTQQFQGYGFQQTPTPQQVPQQMAYHQPPSQQPQYHQPQPPQPAPIDLNALRRDIDGLIARLQARFAVMPHDQTVQAQLTALLQLQQLVSAGSLAPVALQQVQDRVTQMAATAPPPVPTPVPVPQWQPPAPAPLPYIPPPSAAPVIQQPPAYAPPSTQQLFAPGALNGLQALLANGQKPSTPQMRTAMPVLQHATHQQMHNMQNNVAAAPSTNGADLMAALAKSGLLASLPPPPPVQLPPTAQPINAAALPTQQSTAALLQSLQGFLPATSHTSTPTLPPAQLALSKPRIPMTAASLKTFRPDLLRTLYDDQPNQCSTCGRRFLATETGRQNKSRHLDWHFRTNQRIADPQTGRGQHRNWYLDEMAWITLVEVDPSTTSAAETQAAIAAAEKKKARGPEMSFVRAPPGMTRNTCSVCYEEMRSSYSEELQDWVLGNAVVWNGKIAHATCVEEIRKGMGSGSGGAGGAMAMAMGTGSGVERTGSETPDSALGKRKAEGVLAGQGTRVKTS